MKKYFLLSAYLYCCVFTSRAQQPEVLNNYRFFFLPQLFYGNGKADIYGIRQTVLEKLRNSNIPLFLDESEIAREALKKPCSMIRCVVNNASSRAGKNFSNVRIAFLDCKEDTVLNFSADAQIFLAAKETRTSFAGAAKRAMEAFNDYHYVFADPDSSLPVVQKDTINSDSIQWSAVRKLTWDDFKGIPDENEPADALTATSNQTHFETFGVGNRIHVESEITCYFIKSKSWVKKGKEQDYLLNHEQHHFDIAETGSREFRKRLQQTHFTNDNFKDEIKHITEEVNEKYFKLQRQYDDETNHSRIEAKQQEWNKKIEAMLKEYEKYKQD